VFLGEIGDVSGLSEGKGASTAVAVDSHTKEGSSIFRFTAFIGVGDHFEGFSYVIAMANCQYIIDIN
jgi:hypothetical protein